MVSTWPGEHCLESCASPALFATALDALNDECLRLLIRAPQGLRDSVTPPISSPGACLLSLLVS